MTVFFHRVMFPASGVKGEYPSTLTLQALSLCFPKHRIMWYAGQPKGQSSVANRFYHECTPLAWTAEPWCGPWQPGCGRLCPGTVPPKHAPSLIHFICALCSSPSSPRSGIATLVALQYGVNILGADRGRSFYLWDSLILCYHSCLVAEVTPSWGWGGGESVSLTLLLYSDQLPIIHPSIF